MRTPQDAIRDSPSGAGKDVGVEPDGSHAMIGLHHDALQPTMDALALVQVVTLDFDLFSDDIFGEWHRSSSSV